MSQAFINLGLSQTLVEALLKEDIETPTQIQETVIPDIIKNLDMVVQSPTGTGKTLAYLLPLFEKIKLIKEMQILILVPTHELAVQIIRQIERLSNNSEKKIKGTPIIGNVNIKRQIDKLKLKPQIIVGTPGRILELIKKKKISAHTIKTIIIDEADRLFDSNNIETVNSIVRTTQLDRQIMLFSATISPKTITLAKSMMPSPQIIKIKNMALVPDTIKHIYVTTQYNEKTTMLRKLIIATKAQKSLIFINNTNDIDYTIEILRNYGFKVGSLHGSDDKTNRKNTLDKFKSGKINIMVASDLAARGLDLMNVTHVFNIDIPEKKDAYLHRAGRTGRAGKDGTAISIVSDQEIKRLRRHEKDLDIIFNEKQLSRGSLVDA